MDKVYFSDQTFENLDFHEIPLMFGEYENCTFINCNLAQTDVSNFKFFDCEFQNCDLSMVKLHGATLNNLAFRESKLIGIRFDTINNLGLSFKFWQSNLSYCSFYLLDIRKTLFAQCMLHEVDFTEANLSEVLFSKCDLFKSVFYHTNLEKVDFTLATNFQIDPDENKLKGSKFTSHQLPQLLTKHQLIIQ